MKMLARPKLTGTKIAVTLAATALAVAVLGSTPLGHAASGLIANSVGTKQLKNNAVTSAKVKNGSLMGVDFKAGQLPVGPQGPRGDQGPKGDTGPRGQAGANGATNVVIRVNASGSAPIAPGAFGHSTAFCASGERATGGGAYSASKLFITQSYPTGPVGTAPDGWGVEAFNAGASTAGFTPYVVCAST
jgi:hypothetical protein